VSRVFRQIATAVLVATILFALAACSRSSGGDHGKDVAATVNGKEIMLSEVDRLVSQQAQGQKLSTLQQAAVRLQALDNLIQREAVVLRAEKEKTVPTDDEVNTFISQQKQQLTAEEWEKSLKENNLTEEQVRNEARKDLAIKKLQDKLYGKITIRDQEIVDFYNENQEQFVNPRGVNIAGIVTDPRDSRGDDPDDAKSDAEAKAKIDRLYAQLKNGGADFATVAQASSEDQSRVNGGDIGFFNEDKLRQAGFPPDLTNRLFNSMKVGDITEPIHFPDDRWIIFKLTNRQLENKPLKLEDPGVRDQIKQILIDQRQSILQQALIRNAMSDVTVVNHLAESMLNDPNMLGGNQPVSPGASPAAAATQSASPAASATTAPTATTTTTTAPAAPAATAAKPTPTAKPAAAATPKPQPTHAATTTPGPSPKR